MSNKWQRPLWRPTDQTLDSTDSETIRNFYIGKGYENLDRPTKHEKVLTAPVFIRMWELAETPKENHLARLVIGPFYHAMRSCEYLKVQGERRTKKVLCVHNLRFFRGLR
jgi:hypothetical protein